MIVIDGSQGEGGGQILRTALALSIATGTPFRLDNIRAGRVKSGLLRQHLTAVMAAVEVSAGEVEGAEIGSVAIVFRPKRVRSGGYHFAIGTAGSTSLVLQTVLPPLLTADGPSSLVIEGGTHNPGAPPFDFLEHAFLPLVRRMGPGVTAQVERCGFYPAGGGRIRVEIKPAGSLQPLHLCERGATRRVWARAMVANLPRHIGERELKVVQEKFGWRDDSLRLDEIADGVGPGNAVSLGVESENVTEVFTSIGEPQRSAEYVASRAIDEARRYLAAGVPVGSHLADQLMVPMALAGHGSFETVALTSHATTNIEVVRRFLEVPMEVTRHHRDRVEVVIGG